MTSKKVDMEIKLEDSVNHRIATLAILLKRQVLRIIAKNNLNVTPDQWVVMYYLWQEDGLTIGEIACRTKKDFANVTRIIEKLEKLGYVSKRKSEKDSRSSNVFILPKGESIKDKIHGCWNESTEIALKGISEDEQLVLMNLIEKIENNILTYNS